MESLLDMELCLKMEEDMGPTRHKIALENAYLLENCPMKDKKANERMLY